jgi:hypothetical protein
VSSRPSAAKKNKKKTKKKKERDLWVGRMAQEVHHPPCKHKALSSNPSAKNKIK